MKILNKLTLAALFAFTAVSTASAQTKIYIVGAQAMRAQTSPAIQHVLDNNGGGYTYAGTDVITKANAATWTGGNIGGVPVTIKVSYIGGAGGLGAVAGNTTPELFARFLPDGASGSAALDPTTSTGGVPNPNETAPAQIHLGDTFQNSTPFVGTVTLNSGTTVTFTNLTKIKVGAEAFAFVSSNQSKFTNITTQQAVAQFTGLGTLPLSQYTGSSTDASVTVYAIGRNPDAGARTIALAETGIGTATSVFQYQPQDASGNPITTSGGAISQLQPWPVEIVDGLSTNSQGNSGFAQASVEDKVVGGNTLPPNTVLVDYSPQGDAVTTATSPLNGVILSYNGVPYSLANVQNGSYTLWAYMWVYFKPTLSGTPKTFATTLANQILNTDATIKLNTLKVSRSSDGGTVQ